MEPPASTLKTPNLFHAAFLRALGATVVQVSAGEGGHGLVELDVGAICVERIAHEADMLAAQLRQLPGSPTIEQVEQVVGNTILGAIAQAHADLKNRILKRRPR